MSLQRICVYCGSNPGASPRCWLSPIRRWSTAYLRGTGRRLIIADENPAGVLAGMRCFHPPDIEKWLDNSPL